MRPRDPWEDLEPDELRAQRHLWTLVAILLFLILVVGTVRVAL